MSGWIYFQLHPCQDCHFSEGFHTMLLFGPPWRVWSPPNCACIQFARWIPRVLMFFPRKCTRAGDLQSAWRTGVGGTRENLKYWAANSFNWRLGSLLVWRLRKCFTYSHDLIAHTQLPVHLRFWLHISLCISSLCFSDKIRKHGISQIDEYDRPMLQCYRFGETMNDTACLRLVLRVQCLTG